MTDWPERLAALAAALPGYLPEQRWFGAKSRRIKAVAMVDWAPLEADQLDAVLAVGEVRFAEGKPERYFAPVGAAEEVVAALEAGTSEAVGRALLRLLARGARLPSAAGGAFELIPGPRILDRLPAGEIMPLEAEQSNTSLLCGRELVLKLIRKLQDGPNPDVEVLRFLATETGFRHVPPLYGAMEYVSPSGARAVVGSLTGFVPNEGDGWRYMLGLLRDVERTADELHRATDRLGSLTAELHLALASRADAPGFAPEPITAADVAVWKTSIERRIEAVGRFVHERASNDQDADWWPRAWGARLPGLRWRLDTLDGLADGRTVKTRHHGDYHLGQVLKAGDEFVILDFEGEPARPLAERRLLHCPLRDVAGMLRSFDYAVQTVIREQGAGSPLEGGWEAWARSAIVPAYLERARAGGAAFLPAPDPANASRPSSRQDVAARDVIEAFALEKALYEVEYERDHRPDWVEIPLRFLLGGR